MNPEKAQQLLDTYRPILQNCAGVAEFDPAGLTLKHAHDMLNKMQLMLDAEDCALEQKFMRWLGWLQCLMAVHGVRTMEQMREDNR